MNKKYLIKGIILVIMLFVFPSLYAQEWNELTKITVSEGSDFDEFGGAVSVCGDYAVIGARKDDDIAVDCGSVYIFIKEDGVWNLQAQLLASDASAQSQFGNSVSISGDYVAVGAYTSSDNGLYSGSAYIFKRDGTNWNQEAKLLPSDGAADDWFANSVSVFGDYVVIGTPFDDDNGDNSGSAYIFKREDTNWNQEAKLLASDGVTNDEFGFTVAVSGDYVVVGAPLDGGTIGSAYIFKREGTSWSQQAKIEAADAVADIYFGNSVSVSGDYVIIGAYQGNGNVDNSGTAYIFKREDTNWLQQEKLIASDGASGDYFGFSVSVSGNYAVMGAKNDEDSGFHAGTAYIFKKEDADWNEIMKLLPDEVASSDAFGCAVAVFGNNLIVGSRGDDDYGMNSGAAYMYEKDSPSVSGTVTDADTSEPTEGAVITIGTSYTNTTNSSGFYNIEDVTAGTYTLTCELTGYETYTTEINVEGDETINIELQNSSGIDNPFVLQKNISVTNYPNPFKSETTINYSIPVSSNVIIEIYDIQGKKIKTLVNEYQVSGNHSVIWNGTNETGIPVGTGIYFYRLKTDNNIVLKKIMLIKQ
ncbi:MAG: carboxypeptidase-like regulatory domain-containing protein [Bacteroidales bacterium]|nr:carboxypeptidase-like regulatory domain-containing protein [Bacteroidales bacterium]